MANQQDASTQHSEIQKAVDEACSQHQEAHGLALPSGHRSARVCLKLSQAASPLVAAYKQVLPLGGFPIVDSPSDAEVVVTDSLQICQSMLAAGCRVIHLSSENARLGVERPSAGLKSHPEYGARYHCVDALSLVSLYAELSKIEGSDEQAASYSDDSPDFDSVLTKSRVRGLHILVVDNHDLNRASATYQLSEGNSLSVCATYKEAVELLRSKPFDVALLDLLMPPESFTLSDKAFERVVGSEFPAGVFVALAAARAGVKDIRIITDASHHDHPATALIDYIGWGTALPSGNDSRVTFEHARTVQIPRSTSRVNDSAKDWASTFENRDIFGTERTAQTKENE